MRNALPRGCARPFTDFAPGDMGPKRATPVIARGFQSLGQQSILCPYPAKVDTFRKALGLKAHTVVRVETQDAEGELVVQIERLGQHRLRCGDCGLRAPRVPPTRRPERRWHDRAMRDYSGRPMQ